MMTLPNFSERRWDKKRFGKKIRDLGNVIHQIGYQDISHPPVLVGIAEVENALVLQELVASEFLKNKDYDFIHFDSPDERGIDSALLYRKEYFTVLHKEAIPLYINNEFGEQDFTRDILHIKGLLKDEPVHVLVNHWPSRRAGVEVTNYRRLAAADKNKEIISKIITENTEAKIILMGDFNDDPQSESVKSLVGTNLYNPMELLLTNYGGSLSHRGNWNLFDQIVFSNNFLQQHGNTFQFIEANIFNSKSLTVYKGKNKGIPFRTFTGTKYIGGISDLFPVYGIFSVNPKK